MFRKFNTWFDNLKEPRRFLYFMGYMVPTILLVSSSIYPLMISGVIMLTAISIVALTRR
jgi:hypothetical protein